MDKMTEISLWDSWTSKETGVKVKNGRKQKAGVGTMVEAELGPVRR